MELDVVEVCTDCRTHWSVHSEEAKCADPSHKHRRVEVHQHQDMVILPDGSPLTAASFAGVHPYRRDPMPDIGLYLDPRWDPPWPHSHLKWPDFGVPERAEDVARALLSVLEEARVGRRVEIGCLGGHGRTGTALACLAILSGLPSAEALDWVRTSYCAHAVETPEQAAFVAAFLA